MFFQKGSMRLQTSEFRGDMSESEISFASISES